MAPPPDPPTDPAPDPGEASEGPPPRLLSPAFWAMMVFALVSILASLLFVSAGPALFGGAGRPQAAKPAAAAVRPAPPPALGGRDKGR